LGLVVFAGEKVFHAAGHLSISIKGGILLDSGVEYGIIILMRRLHFDAGVVWRWLI
jgi:hypothetical protein